MTSQVWVEDGKFVVRGDKKDTLLGRSSFKWAALATYHFAGRGDEIEGGAENAARRWVAHNQQMFDREDVVLRVFGQTSNGAPGSWGKLSPGEGMFGSPPWDLGIWDIPLLRRLCDRNDRVRELTAMHENVLDFAFRVSHETGCVFEWCIDATLKHIEGLCTGIVDHCIRQVGAHMRELQPKYPNAAFIVSARNEWDAHNKTNTTLSQVNMWATRWYRWKKTVAPHDTKQSGTAPGTAYAPEQFPEALIIVDHGGRDTFDYDCGPEPSKFKAGMIHPVRKNAGRDWRELPDMERLRTDARGQPVGATESMYFVSKDSTQDWYRNRNGWTDNMQDQLRFYDNCLKPEGFDYFIVHDDIGAQTSDRFNPDSAWERELANFLGGQAGGGPAPGPDPGVVVQLRYERIIAKAYDDILGRQPDATGLSHYNGLMAEGLSEADLRESLIRSIEYETKNPGAEPAPESPAPEAATGVAESTTSGS